MKYLTKNCDAQKLHAIIKERSLWIERKSATHYKQLLNNLPNIHASKIDLDSDVITVGDPSDITESERDDLYQKCQQLIPWRKGPFNLFGIDLDSEWQSDAKWARLKPFLPNLEGKKILDIGCNNGYYMFKLAASNPELVLGIDPVLHVHSQFHLIQNYVKNPALKFELLGMEHVNHFDGLFDFILSMGIIYHHRNPIEQLLSIRKALKPGGQLILETIGIPGDSEYALFPKDRYANMKNVWFIPTLSCFINWVHKAKFIDIELISDTPLTTNEQRLTKWCPPPHQSLENFLNPDNSDQTIEGHPAPRRFALIARRKP